MSMGTQEDPRGLSGEKERVKYFFQSAVSKVFCWNDYASKSRNFEIVDLCIYCDARLPLRLTHDLSAIQLDHLREIVHGEL